MKLSLFALALGLTACTELAVPMASPESDAQGRAFPAPPPADGALYVYAPARPQPAVWGVTVAGRQIGDLAPGTWLRVTLPAGEHDVRCTGGRVGTPSLLVRLSPGETRYIELGKHWIEVQCTMQEVAAATAQPAILAGKRVRELH